MKLEEETWFLDPWQVGNRPTPRFAIDIGAAWIIMLRIFS
jgi:hypothetical protein